MFCSSCGTSLTPNLSYCNRCGASLRPPEGARGKPLGLALIVWFGVLMMGTPFPAMIIVFDAIIKLKEAGFPLSYIISLAVISLLTIFGAVVLLSRLLSPLFRAYLDKGESVESRTPELASRPTPQLEEPREPVSSVTESTTRAFEPVYREHNSR